MRNGINVAAISEATNEVRYDPAERFVTFALSGHRLSSRHLCIGIDHIKAGTLTIGRDIALNVDAGACLQYPDPMELFLTGLGSCYLITFLYGCSFKGITLDRLALTLEASSRSPLSMKIDVKGDGSLREFDEIRHTATMFSPNLRTVLESNTINARPSLSATTEQPPALTDDGMGYRACFEWITGPLAHVTVGSVLLEAGNHALAVDQPKQLFGLDNAPNPQEYLLAGVLAELLAQPGINDGQALSLKATADLNGFLLAENVPVRLIDIEVSPHLPPVIAGAVCSPLVCLITPQPVEIDLCVGDTNLPRLMLGI